MAVTRRKPAKKRRIPAKKSTVKPKPRKRSPAARKPRKQADKDTIGVVTHYFPKVRAAVIKLTKPLAVGDRIRIKGHTTDLKQAVASMQIDHVRVVKASKGDEIGLAVSSRVREHDAVLKI